MSKSQKKNRNKAEDLRIALLVYHFFVQKTQMMSAEWLVPNRDWLTAKSCEGIYRRFFLLELEDSRDLFKTAKKMANEGFFERNSYNDENNKLCDWFSKGKFFYEKLHIFLNEVKSENPWLNYLRGNLFLHQLLEETDLQCIFDLFTITLHGTDELSERSKIDIGLLTDLLTDDFIEKKLGEKDDPHMAIIKGQAEIIVEGRVREKKAGEFHQNLINKQADLEKKLDQALTFMSECMAEKEHASENEQLNKAIKIGEAENLRLTGQIVELEEKVNKYLEEKNQIQETSANLTNTNLELNFKLEKSENEIISLNNKHNSTLAHVAGLEEQNRKYADSINKQRITIENLKNMIMQMEEDKTTTEEK